MDKKWEAVSTPPPTALKTIGAGRLKGKSDINPQWRFKAMTETYGMCGVGWKYEISRLWTEAASEGQVFAFATVNVYTKDGGEWSAPIPGVGGNMMIVNEAKGPHSNDECYKMAVTDALSTAMKAIGVAAEIYLGKWDGSKYSASPAQQQGLTQQQTQPTGQDKGTAKGPVIKTFEKEGSGNRGPWHLWKFTIGETRDLGTFDESVAHNLMSAEIDAQNVVAEWESNFKGNKEIKSIGDIRPIDNPPDASQAGVDELNLPF